MKAIYILAFALLVLFCAASFGQQQSFEVGDTVSVKDLTISKTEIVRRSIGNISDEARKKHKTFDNYVAARRRDSIAGKGFEAFFSIDYNASEKTRFVLLPTASLGKPTDPADLALIDRGTGKIVELYQCKIGATAAVHAASDPKYAEFKIVVPCDTLTEITTHANSDTQAYLSSGKITDTIGTVMTQERYVYERRSIEYLRSVYQKQEK